MKNQVIDNLRMPDDYNFDHKGFFIIYYNFILLKVWIGVNIKKISL